MAGIGLSFSKNIGDLHQDKCCRTLGKGSGSALRPDSRGRIFDVAALVSAGCLNAGALMGAHISVEQVYQVEFLASHLNIRVINLFWTGMKLAGRHTKSGIFTQSTWVCRKRI